MRFRIAPGDEGVGRGVAPQQRALLVGAPDGDAALGVARQHGGVGVAVRIAVARLHHDGARHHRVEQGLARRRLAAVMRRQQHVGIGQQIGALQGALLRLIDVAGEQYRGAARGHMQHAGAGVVAAGGVAGRGVDDAEVHVVPAPVLAGGAGLALLQAVAGGGVWRGRGEQIGLGVGAGEGGCAARVIAVVVTHHHAVETAHAQAVQQRQQHAATGVHARRLSRPGVVQQGVPRGAHHYRHALSDIGKPHLHRPSLGRGAGVARQWQQQQQTGRAQPPVPRQRQRQHAERGQRQRETVGRGGVPLRQRPVGHLAQHRVQALLHPGPEPPRPAVQRRGQQQAADRQRRNHQGDHGNRQSIGQRREHRDLLKEQQRERQQGDSGHPLRVRGAAQRLSAALQPTGGRGFSGAAGQRCGFRVPAVARNEQHAHRHERQPEPGLPNRPRIPQQHGGQRQRHHVAPVGAQPPLAQQQHHREHQQGALRRHAPARDERVGGGDQQRAPGGDGGGGKGQRPGMTQPGALPPQTAHETQRQPGQQGDVQTGNTHQMRDAGDAVSRPVLRGNGALIAQSQRDDGVGSGDGVIAPPPRRGGGREGVRRVLPLQRGHHALAQVVAQLRDPVGRRAAKAEKLRGRAHAAHGSGSADALAEQRQFGVVAARIGEAMRALEAHRKLPFLAGMHSRRSFSRAGTVTPRIPAQRHLARYPGRGGRGDREDEARGIGVEHRQPGHHAAHLDDLAFERRIEAVGQQRSGAPARQPESERKTAAGEQKFKGDALPLLLFVRPAAVAALPQQQRRSQSDACGRHHAVNRLRPERGLRGLQRTAQQDGKGKGRQVGFLQAAGRGFIAGRPGVFPGGRLDAS